MTTSDTHLSAGWNFFLDHKGVDRGREGCKGNGTAPVRCGPLGRLFAGECGRFKLRSECQELETDRCRAQMDVIILYNNFKYIKSAVFYFFQKNVDV